MRPIDADAAIKKLGGECIAKYPNTFTMGLLAAMEEVGKMPTIEQPTWISCAERLPTAEDANPNESVLAINKDDGFGRSWIWDIVVRYPQEFTHWMPIPKPPKGDE